MVEAYTQALTQIEVDAWGALAELVLTDMAPQNRYVLRGTTGILIIQGER